MHDTVGELVSQAQIRNILDKPHFDRPVQTATALQRATGINRTVFTQAATKGIMGEAAYKAEDTWLFDTSHPDFDKWYQAHWNQPRVKGKKKPSEGE